MIKYTDKIADLWPEFAKGGNEPQRKLLTVSDLLRHEAGLAAFDVDLDGKALQDLDALAKRMAKAPLQFPANTTRCARYRFCCQA